MSLWGTTVLLSVVPAGAVIGSSTSAYATSGMYFDTARHAESWRRWVQKVSKFDWDALRAEGMEPPSDFAVDVFKQVGRFAAATGEILPPTHVTFDPIGGIVMTWVTGRAEGEVVIYNDCSIDTNLFFDGKLVDSRHQPPPVVEATRATLTDFRLRDGVPQAVDQVGPVPVWGGRASRGAQDGLRAFA